MCRPPGRPKSIFDDFGIDFGLILASRFHQNFDLFRMLPKSRFYWKNNEKSMIFHPRGLPFPSRFPIKFSRSFRMPPKTSFFRPWIARGHQKVAVLIFLDRFWRPSSFRDAPKIGQNRPRGVKGPKKATGPLPPFSFYALPWSRSFLKIVPGHHFCRFGDPRGSKNIDFCMLI